MQRHLVLAGAGHCHLEILGNLETYRRRGWKVTLVSPGAFWYSGMGPGVLSGVYPSCKHRVDTPALVRKKGGNFVKDAVCRIDAIAKTVETASGKIIPYDLLSLNVGSEVATSKIDGADDFGWTVKPIVNLSRLRNAIVERAGRGEKMRIVVAGGGPAGCEVAINIWHLLTGLGSSPEIQIFSPGSSLLEKEGVEPGRRIARELERRKIGVRLGRKVVRATRTAVYLDDQSAVAADFFVVATGVQPPSVFSDSGLATAVDGSLLVNRNLQSVGAPEVFGAGDCIGFEDGIPPRVGVYAVRESKVLHHNLLAAIDGRRLRPFRSRKSYLLILNLGDGTGLLLWCGKAWRGRWAFWLKDFLDRRFVERYRAN